MMEIREIKQIAPADGWFAVYKDEEGTPVRIAVWASVIVEDGDDVYPAIVGYVVCDGYLDSAEETSNFAAYRHKDDLPCRGYEWK